MAEPQASVDRALRAAGFKPALWGDILYERAVSKLFALHVQLWFDEGLEAAVWITCERADALLADDGLTASVEAELDEFDDVEGLVAAVKAAAASLEPFGTVEGFLAQDDLDPRVVAAVRDAAAGRRPSSPGGEDMSFGSLLKEGLKRAQERRENPLPPEDRRQLSWSDLLRTGRTLKRVLDGEATVVPERDRPWQRVELAPGAAPVLTRAREASTMPDPGRQHTSRRASSPRGTTRAC